MDEEKRDRAVEHYSAPTMEVTLRVLEKTIQDCEEFLRQNKKDSDLYLSMSTSGVIGVASIVSNLYYKVEIRLAITIISLIIAGFFFTRYWSIQKKSDQMERHLAEIILARMDAYKEDIEIARYESNCSRDARKAAFEKSAALPNEPKRR